MEFLSGNLHFVEIAKKWKKKNGRKAASDLNEVNFVNFPLLKQGRHKNQFYHTFI